MRMIVKEVVDWVFAVEGWVVCPRWTLVVVVMVELVRESKKTFVQRIV